MENLPTRYISSFALEFISDFICFCAEKYQITPDEIAILSVVGSESVREIRNDAYLAKNYGNEEKAFPFAQRLPVSVKFVQTRLGMSRETTRRKLEDLARRKFIQKVNGGFSVSSQIGPDDYSFELRKYLVDRLSLLDKYIKKMPV